jgi:murein L,D-transpeptidase YcbB/YkuD
MHRLHFDHRSITAVLVLTIVGTGSVRAVQHTGHVDAAVPELRDTSSAPTAAPAFTPQRPVPFISEDAPYPGPAGSLPLTIGSVGDPAFVGRDAADLPIVEKLRDIVLTRQLERIINRKRERDAIEAFYVTRNFVPLWIEGGAANERASAAIAHLKTADVDGLDPADYDTPEFNVGMEPSMVADAELRLTAAVLAYTRHAQAGRVHFSRISSEISYDLAVPDPSDVLTSLANAPNIAKALASYNPPHPGYKTLKTKLAEIRRQYGDASRFHIANGPVLRVGMRDERVPLLRMRLGLNGEAGDTAYDNILAEAVTKIQRQHNLPVTGTLNPATIAALNVWQRQSETDIIVANMERWRWLPRDFGNTYSILNVPDFTLTVVRDGVPVWKTKVVVGTPETPTPLFSDKIQFITVNPTWIIPPSIMNKKYLPALQQDPAVLDRLGIRVTRNSDGSLRLYQPPGNRNALGRLRFNFPNKFMVYQHDTPDKYLFDRPSRAYSNGCMRVQDPAKYAEVLLSIALPTEGYTQERLRKMFGGTERNITFPTHVPVHLTYQTALIDESGKLVIRDDIYGYDKRLQAALKGDNRRVADIAVPAVHKHGGERNPRPLSLQRPGIQDARGGSPFFERLFR